MKRNEENKTIILNREKFRTLIKDLKSSSLQGMFNVLRYLYNDIYSKEIVVFKIV